MVGGISIIDLVKIGAWIIIVISAVGLAVNGCVVLNTFILKTKNKHCFIHKSPCETRFVLVFKLILMNIKKLPITREQAVEIIRRYNSHTQDIIHYLESEAVMRELAEHLGLSKDEVEYWAMLGLLHDIDWGITKEKVETHLTKAGKILKEVGFDQEFIGVILSHGYGFDELPHLKDKKRSERIHYALAASETITGLVHAYALMRQGKISDMKVSGLKKKFKDKTFASKVSREIIMEIENLGINLDEFFKIAIEGIKKIKDDVGLK